MGALAKEAQPPNFFCSAFEKNKKGTYLLGTLFAKTWAVVLDFQEEEVFFNYKCIIASIFKNTIVFFLKI